MSSGLNDVLTLEANLDQTGRAFIQDLVMSMFDEGVVAAVPIDTSEDPEDPEDTDSFNILSMRTGRIVAWFPEHIRVRLYDQATGLSEEIVVPKRMAAIIENPFYAVMNEPNGTFKRLLRKLAILDAIDEQSGSGKLDLIIQLPYVIKNRSQKEAGGRPSKRHRDATFGL